MAFADDFAACMGNAGIQMDPSVVPDAATLGPVLDYVKQYLQNLDPDVAAGLDAATNADPVSVGLADSDVGVVDPSYIGLLQAFDAAIGFPLSVCLQWCDHCLAQASSSGST
jgi:hypothetical protein